MPEFWDSKFMTAKEKNMVLKQWRTFLKNGCKWDHFTDRLYKHLTLHCSFIAHYNRLGFYETYFQSGSDRLHFFSQFDLSQGGVSVEYGMTIWRKGEYEDINTAMCKVFAEFCELLEDQATLNHLHEAEVELQQVQEKVNRARAARSRYR